MQYISQVTKQAERIVKQEKQEKGNEIMLPSAMLFCLGKAERQATAAGNKGFRDTFAFQKKNLGNH